MKNILIAGCGDVGTSLALRLIAEGHCVWGLRRNPQGLPAGIKRISGDLRLPLEATNLPREVDQIVFLPTPDARDATAYREIFVDGIRHVVEALGRGSNRPSRLLFVSSTSVYGQNEGEPVNETSMTTPDRFSGQTLLEAERIAANSPVPTTVIRFAGIYGPGRNRMIERVKNGVPCPSTPTHYTNRIHRDDCAGFLAHVLAMPSPAPIYIGVDNEPVAQRTVIDWIADHLGVARAPEPPLGSATQAISATTGKRCSNEALRSTGYVLDYPTFREGYARLVADL